MAQEPVYIQCFVSECTISIDLMKPISWPNPFLCPSKCNEFFLPLLQLTNIALHSFEVFSNRMMKHHHQCGGTGEVQGEWLVEVFSRGLVQFSPQVSNDKTNPTLDCVQTFHPRTIMLMPLVILNSIFGLILTSLEQNDWANSKEICFPKWRRWRWNKESPNIFVFLSRIFGDKNIVIITNDNTTRPFSICKSGLHKLRHPGITAARKWRYNEKMKR